MDELLRWIRSKHVVDSILIDGSRAKSDGRPKQMLIGYMIEYCNEHKLSFDIPHNSTVDQTFKHLMKEIKKYQKKIAEEDKSNNRKFWVDDNF